MVNRWESGEESKATPWLHSLGGGLAWVSAIPSAVAFLIGAFPNQIPEGFSPYVDCDTETGMEIFIKKGFSL